MLTSIAGALSETVPGWKNHFNWVDYVSQPSERTFFINLETQCINAYDIIRGYPHVNYNDTVYEAWLESMYSKEIQTHTYGIPLMHMRFDFKTGFTFSFNLSLSSITLCTGCPPDVFLSSLISVSRRALWSWIRCDLLINNVDLAYSNMDGVHRLNNREKKKRIEIGRTEGERGYQESIHTQKLPENNKLTSSKHGKAALIISRVNQHQNPIRGRKENSFRYCLSHLKFLHGFECSGDTILCSRHGHFWLIILSTLKYK